MAQPPNIDTEIPKAVIEPRKGGPRVSIVWLIPLLAALIGGWLAYKTLTERGPLITISFKTAQGLEVGKTLVKFRDIEVGKVEAIDVNDDLSGVVVSVRLDKKAEPYLTDKTRFWVVTAEVTAAGVSGLGTLFAGAYIGMDPVSDGKPTRAFVGLEDVPLITTDDAGTRLVLRTETGGSMSKGAPVYYKRYRVGEVSETRLSDDGQSVEISIFVEAPHDEFVRKNTRFWNASGVNLTLDAEGIDLDTPSLISAMIGGVAFDSPSGAPQGGRAEQDTEFTLYPNREAAFEVAYEETQTWIAHFAGSVRGLSIGAPVELRGIPIGRVADFGIAYDAERNEVTIPVTLEIEPELLSVRRDQMTDDERRARLDAWVERGMRAQLKTGNLVTGQLLVELDFFPDPPPATIVWTTDPPTFPTVPATTQQLVEKVTVVADRLAEIPFEDIGTGVSQAVKRLDVTLTEAQGLLARLKAETVPAATLAIKQAEGTLTTAERAIAADSPLRQDLDQTLEDVARAARSLKVLLDYLEQHPEALIRGKGRGGN